MTLEGLLLTYQGQLKSLESETQQVLSGFTPDSLLREPLLLHEFEQPNKLEDDLLSLNLSQLNKRKEVILNDITELRQIREINDHLQEVKSLLKKDKTVTDLLDFQQLFTLFKGFKVLPTGTNLLIYTHIAKVVDQEYEVFLEQLEDYLKLLVPDEFTIANIGVLNQFNDLLTKNSIRLSYYKTLRTKWDKLIATAMVSVELILDDEKLLDYDSVEMNSTATSNPNFLKSTYNFIEFINYLGLSSIKQYLNSKISQLLVEKISVRIKEIIHDESQIKQLKQLVDMSKLTNWNILHGFDTNTSSISDSLNNLYQDWILDNYVDTIRKAFYSNLIKEEGQHDDIQEVEEDLPNEDAWDDNWDDNWDDDNEGKKAPSSPKKTALPVSRISKLPARLISIINEFNEKEPKDSSLLVSAIIALSSTAYPSLTQSFLLANDFEYLSEKLQIADFAKAANTNWNQVKVRHYEELKILVSSLNLDDEVQSAGSSDEFFELDDYNLTQLSLIYKWFNRLFQDTELKLTNSIRFQDMVKKSIEFLNNWLIESILSLLEITEYQSNKLAEIIDSLNNATVPFLIQADLTKDSIKSYNKLTNIKVLISNHLKDIMDKFYEGELFDIETTELISIIESVFIESDQRTDAIDQIREFRAIT